MDPRTIMEPRPELPWGSAPHLRFDHNNSRIDDAILFASAAHDGQRRKYSGVPYIQHPLAVARTLWRHGRPVEEIMAGVLHDTVEDCDVGINDICEQFGSVVADLVGWLTDVSKPEDGNRAARKAIDRAHSQAAPVAAKNVKLADIYDNTNDIVVNDPNFAVVYLDEVAKTIEGFQDADPVLFSMVYYSIEVGRRVTARYHEMNKSMKHFLHQ